MEKSRRDFLNSIKAEDKSYIIYLKMKLENKEIRALDLTNEQIDEIQKIYDREIIEKQNILRRYNERKNSVYAV